MKCSKGRRINSSHGGLDIASWSKATVVEKINKSIANGNHDGFKEPIALRDLTGVIGLACAMSTGLLDQETAIKEEAAELE
eukprot:5826934-Amphidinium_carterae.1